MSHNSSDFCTACDEHLSSLCDACAAERESAVACDAYHEGAAVAFGLMGMAEAIRDRKQHANPATRAWFGLDK